MLYILSPQGNSVYLKTEKLTLPICEIRQQLFVNIDGTYKQSLFCTMEMPSAQYNSISNF